MRKIPELYVQFIDRMLTDRCTRLKFNGYTSDWMAIDNGIVQGDPLSMLLYLFYNTDLLADPKKEEAKLAYVDDANFYAEGDDFQEVYDCLWDMMCREWGGQDWSKAHNSHFELSKLALVGFTRKQVRDPSQPGKMISKPWPNFEMQGITIKPSNVHKYLGVLFNQELQWQEQVEHVTAKAAKWSLCFRRLAKPQSGIRPKQMRWLY